MLGLGTRLVPACEVIANSIVLAARPVFALAKVLLGLLLIKLEDTRVKETIIDHQRPWRLNMMQIGAN